MPSTSVLNRIGKVNFFAVLPAGFFILMSIFIASQKIVDNATALDHLWESIICLSLNPMSIILLLFVVYILGSIVQINSVYFTENLTPPKFFSGDPFPFPGELKDTLLKLKKLDKATKHDTTKFPDLEVTNEKDLILAFNYWKDLICMKSPEAFDYYQTHEAQTRFYAGMYISSLIGLICSIILFFRASFEFYPPAIILFIICIMLILLIGSQFHRVRRKEAFVLMFQYIIYLQD